MRLGPTQLLTICEVATALRVSESSVRRLIASGEIAAKKIGGSIRVPEEALADFLAGASIEVSPGRPKPAAARRRRHAVDEFDRNVFLN